MIRNIKGRLSLITGILMMSLVMSACSKNSAENSSVTSSTTATETAITDTTETTDGYYGYDVIVENSVVISADNVYSANKAYEELTNRGFDNLELVALYDMDANLIEKVVDATDTTCYPVYIASYFTEEGDCWQIYIYGKTIMANPLNYNIESDKEVLVLVTESASVVSYDSSNNTLNTIAPSVNEMEIVVVKAITKDVLDTVDLEIPVP